MDMVEPEAEGILEGKYISDCYAGSGALVSHTVGRGKVFYYGSAFSESAAGIFLEKLGVANPWGNILELPECCELAICGDGVHRFAIILNYLKTLAEIRIHRPVRDLITGEKREGVCTLPGYGTLTLEL